MTAITKHAPIFMESLEKCIKNFLFLDKGEQQLLLVHARNLMVDSFASLFRTEQRLNRKKNGRTLARILQKLHEHRDEVEQLLFDRNLKLLDRRKPVCIAVDDHGLDKRGEKIHATGRVFDHGKNLHYHGHCVVDAACVQDNLLLVNKHVIQVLKKKVAILPGKKRNARKRAVTTKITHAIDLVRQMAAKLVDHRVVRNKIWVLADRWFPCGAFVNAVRHQGVYFLLAVKKNTVTFLPDRKAMDVRQTGRRGRPRKYRPRRVSIARYFRQYRGDRYFIDRTTGRRVWWKTAVLITPAYGRVRVFAFHLETSKEWRYFISNNLRLTPARALFLYKQRWPIECLHKEIKQYFGLKKSRVRRSLPVQGHFVFVYLLHGVFCEIRWKRLHARNVLITAQHIWDEVFIDVTARRTGKLIQRNLNKAIRW